MFRRTTLLYTFGALATVTIFAATFTACKSLTRDVVINLPSVAKQLVVESYLEPGAPYLLLLTETQDYFGPVQNPIIEGALVTIRHNGNTDTLRPQAINYGGQKAVVYLNFKAVPDDYQSEFELYVRTPDGRTCSARTHILPPVVFDSLNIYHSGKDNKAALVAKWKDNPATEDYYRFVLYRNRLDTFPERTSRISDRLLNGQEIFLVTGYNYYIGKDTLYAQLYHIDKAYNDYLASVSAAANANGNPFAQPAAVQSNIIGGIGIFTGFPKTQQRVIVQ